MPKITPQPELERLFKPLIESAKLFNKGDEKAILEELVQEKTISYDPLPVEKNTSGLINVMVRSIKKIEPKVHFYDVGTVVVCEAESVVGAIEELSVIQVFS